MRLNLGCGTKKLEGWINIDAVEACQPDVIHDITQPLPYADLTADEVLAEDLLEHFDKYARYLVFCEWARVLKVNGKMTIQVPNFKKIIFRYFKLGFNNFVDTTFGENLWQSKIYNGHFGNHKWGYSEDTLEEFVLLFGIEPLKVDKIGLNLRLYGEKRRHVVLSELEETKIYSSANQCGVGEPLVAVGFAAERIKEFHAQENGHPRENGDPLAGFPLLRQ